MVKFALVLSLKREKIMSHPASSLYEKQKDEVIDALESEINIIFAQILAKSSEITHTMVNAQDFKQALVDYKLALIKEVRVIPFEYDHPLRAAKTLHTLITSTNQTDFQKNLKEFNKQAVDTKFHPKTRWAGWIVGSFLLSLVIVLLLKSIILAPLGVGLAICAAGLTGAANYHKFSPYFDAVNQGKTISSFFNSKPPMQGTEANANDHVLNKA